MRSLVLLVNSSFIRLFARSFATDLFFICLFVFFFLFSNTCSHDRVLDIASSSSVHLARLLDHLAITLFISSFVLYVLVCARSCVRSIVCSFVCSLQSFARSFVFPFLFVFACFVKNV